MGYIFRPVLGQFNELKRLTYYWSKQREQSEYKDLNKTEYLLRKLNKWDLLTGKHNGMASINAAKTSQYYSISRY